MTEFSNNAVRFLADTGFSASYPGGNPPADPANPTNGQIIYDVAGISNASISAPSAQLTYSGGGLDFTSSSTQGQGIVVPASVMADIYNGYGGVAQKFLAMMYCKLPSSANWPTGTDLQSIMGDGADTGSAGALGSVNMINFTSPGRMQGRRQTAASTGNTSAALTVSDFSGLAQVAWWRSATEYGMRVRTASGAQIYTAASGSDNTNASSFAGNTFTFGRPSVFGVAGVKNYFSGFRVYRCAMVNLARSTPASITDVLDRDWSRVVARGAFS